MNPIINYELGKAQHREYEAKFEQYWRNKVDQPDQPKAHRFVWGLGSLALGVFVIIQAILS